MGLGGYSEGSLFECQYEARSQQPYHVWLLRLDSILALELDPLDGFNDFNTKAMCGSRCCPSAASFIGFRLRVRGFPIPNHYDLEVLFGVSYNEVHTSSYAQKGLLRTKTAGDVEEPRFTRVLRRSSSFLPARDVCATPR